MKKNIFKTNGIYHILFHRLPDQCNCFLPVLKLEKYSQYTFMVTTCFFLPQLRDEIKFCQFWKKEIQMELETQPVAKIQSF